MSREDDRLTPREKEIMELLCRGMTAKDIAAQLGIAWRTVDNTRTVIYRVMGVHSLGAMISRAIRRGMYDPFAAVDGDCQ